MKKLTLTLLLVLGIPGGGTLTTSARADQLADESPRWFYAPVNFQVDENVDQLISLLSRAKQAGYNGAVITDYKFGKIDGRPERYYRNLERTRETAKQLGIDLIPAVMQVGYSNSILQNNPNLAAGLPVVDCEFIAKGGRAVVASDINLLPGGDFETSGRRAPEGWDWIDAFGESTSLDTETKHSGKSSLRMHRFSDSKETGGNCRVAKRVTLKPFHQYQLTFWAKTDQLNVGEFKALPMATDGGQILSFAYLGSRATQDWTRHSIVFNSLQHSQVNLLLGMWSAKSGQAWIDDVRLTEIGGVNLLRREGCPIRVTNEDGSIEYKEGHDFERWHDEKLGRVPYLGEYDDAHSAPAIGLTNDSRIRDGQRLKVSFYHTVLIHDGQVCCSLVADELFIHFRRELELLNQHLRPKHFLMSHDEIRVAGWDKLAKGRSSGELLANNVRRCRDLIGEVVPKAKVAVWSDMFDPNHNARDNYYLTRGSMKNSWQGLDSSTIIVNWNGGKALQSLKFFADRGHTQIIAGYYDQDVETNVTRWMKAAKNIQGVAGFMYTTWQRRYNDLEKFSDLVSRSE